MQHPAGSMHIIKHGLPKVAKPNANMNTFSTWLQRLSESTKTKDDKANSFTNSKEMHLVVLGESAAEILYNALNGIDLSSSGSHQCLVEYGFVQENHDLGFTRDLHIWVLRNPKNVSTLKDVIPGDPNKNHITYFIGIDLGQTWAIQKQLDDWIGNTKKLQAALLDEMLDEEVRRRKRKMAGTILPEEDLGDQNSAKENSDSSLKLNLGAPIIIVGTRTQDFKRRLNQQGRDYHDYLVLVMAHLRAEGLKLGASIFSSDKDESWKNGALIKFLKTVAVGEEVAQNHCMAQYTNEHGGYAIPAGADSLALIQISLPEGHKLEEHPIEQLFKEDTQQRSTLITNSEFKAKSELNDTHFMKLLKFEIESAANYHKHKTKAQVKKFSSGSNKHSSALSRKPTETVEDKFTALERKMQVSKQQADLLRAVIGRTSVPDIEAEEHADTVYNKPRKQSSRDDTDDWMNKKYEDCSLITRKREESL